MSLEKEILERIRPAPEQTELALEITEKIKTSILALPVAKEHNVTFLLRCEENADEATRDFCTTSRLSGE